MCKKGKFIEKKERNKRDQKWLKTEKIQKSIKNVIRKPHYISNHKFRLFLAVWFFPTKCP